ncbi:Casein kinase II regulatory subunit family protein [Histomonas meleagridis]|uniref:Casein kinase II regulatory subunit family protein n=1 Tax=Histomonas meleagridis TaxID=135588 RepID=UPI003559B1CF|nr:Casein kinase II regulatory subunit family protein [Histomonas meleagridis]KAH0797103.1 Casein kinase II regulatory subunit family protein [Histomonas meleagridis]
MRNIEKLLPVAYGLVHSRFVISPDGLYDVQNKYSYGIYGKCPRISCKEEKVIPIGTSSKLGKANVKVFCPCCREIYEPYPKIDLDGAFFGPNMAHIFIDEMTDGGVKIVEHRKNYRKFERKAFGFRVRLPARE